MNEHDPILPILEEETYKKNDLGNISVYGDTTEKYTLRILSKEDVEKIVKELRKKRPKWLYKRNLIIYEAWLKYYQEKENQIRNDNMKGIQISKRELYFYIQKTLKNEFPLLCNRTIKRITKREYQQFKRRKGS